MYIESITIYGFGKFVDKQIVFDKGFNVLLGHNEDGKSTIQQFIKSVLFGFSNQRKKETNHYISKKASQHGGKVVLNQTKYGRVIVERIKKKDAQKLNVMLGDGTLLQENSLLDILNYLDEEMFDRFFSLNLSNLTMLSQLKSNELSRYFLTLGKENSDKLFNIVDNLDKNANDIYSEKAIKKPLNQQLDKLQQVQTDVAQLQQKQADYTRLITQKKDLLQQIEKNNSQFNALNKEIQQLVHVKDILPKYEQYKQLIKAKNPFILQQVSERDFEQYLEYQKRIAILKEEKVKYQERKQGSYQSAHHIKNKQFEWYLQYHESNKSIVKSLPKIEQIIQQSVKLAHELEIKQNLLLQEKERLNMTSVPQLTQEFIQDVVVYEKSIADVTQKSEQLQYKKEKLRQQLDGYFVQSQQKSNHLWQPTIIGVIGLCCVVLSFLLNYPLVVMSLGMSGVLYSFWKIVQINQTNKKQQQILENKVNQIQEHILSVDKCLVEYEQHVETIQQQFVCAKEKFNLPQHITLMDVTSGRLENISNLEKSVQQLMKQQIEMDTLCQQQLTIFKDYMLFSDITISQNAYATLLQKVCVSFKDYMANMRVIETEYLHSQKQLHVFENDIQKVDRDILGLIEHQEKLRARVDIQTDEQFVVTLQQQYHIKKELDNLNSLLKGYELEQLEKLDSVVCHNQIEHGYEQIECLQKIQQDNYNELSQLNYAIEKLEHYGVYEQLNQEAVVTEEATKSLVIDYSSYVVAKKLIEKLLSNGQVDYLDRILNQVSVLFFKVTQKYTKVMYDKEQIVVMDVDDQRYFVYELSQGTKEQLYLMFRLAIVLLVQDKVNLPIVIDDCFVNFDRNRRARLYELLNDIAKTHQILYTTFNEIDRIPANHIISLREVGHG